MLFRSLDFWTLYSGASRSRASESLLHAPKLRSKTTTTELRRPVVLGVDFVDSVSHSKGFSHMTCHCPLPKRGAKYTICASTLHRLDLCPLSTFPNLLNMMHPTCTNVRVSTARDAEIIFHPTYGPPTPRYRITDGSMF